MVLVPASDVNQQTVSLGQYSVPALDFPLEDSTCKLAKAAGVPLHRFPETPQEADLIEELLAQAMDNLSMNRHEEIIFDIHGFLQTDENPSVIEASLKEMDYELLLIGPKEKAAYLLAHSLDPVYVTSRSVRLLFLRYQRYDARKAAQTMVQHFEAKRNLFGDGEVLARAVRQSDLSPKDLEALDSGYIQLLPTRDAAGRAIMLNMEPAASLKSHLKDSPCDQRVVWYLSMKALEDEATQINGVVWVVILNRDAFRISTQELYCIQRLDMVLPYRNVVGHVCYSDPELRPYVTGCQLFSPEEERYRFRVHFGTRDEIIFELLTFGIPEECYKMRANGTHDCSDHLQWLALQKAQEEKDTTVETHIIIPNRIDVLFGKTAMAKQHPGTLRALHLVESHYESYEQLEKFDKAQVTEKILHCIRSAGGRFLRQDNGAWVIVSEGDARKKIAHWFRHSRHKRRSSTGMNGESKQAEDVPVPTPTFKQTRPLATSDVYGLDDPLVSKRKLCEQPEK
eukprot:Nitzschia sp. Nitz4//scaffold36_size144017//28036//29659//NITZ4_003069-RA/size144017-snap-gene-0.205-mRNA-1//-1//CDS//3329549405//6614//frame0